MTAAARLQRVRARVDGLGFHYTRVILPLMAAAVASRVAVEREAGDGMRIEPA